MKRYFLFLIIGFFIFECNAQNWDINTLKRINRIDNSFIRGYSKTFSKTEPYVALGIPVALGTYALFDKDRGLLNDAIYIGTSVAEAFTVTYAMKYAVYRERPFEHYPDLIDKRENASSPSFPSTHVATAFSLATSLSIKYPKWYIIAPTYAWACSVGFARMNEGVHYPSDVIAGAAIGTGCAVINMYVNKWLNKLIFLKEKSKVTNDLK